MISFTSWVVACAKLNLLFCVTDDLIAIRRGWFWYVSMIFPTVVSSSEGFAEPPNEHSLVSKDFSTPRNG